MSHPGHSSLIALGGAGGEGDPGGSPQPQRVPGHKIDVLLAGPQLVWLRAKAAEWGISEGAALRRLIDAYREAEARAEAQPREGG